MNQTIAAYWEDFRKDVISPDAPEIQLREMRRSFYAGFHAMLEANIKIADMSENAACALLDSLWAESNQFVQDVMAGRA